MHFSLIEFISGTVSAKCFSVAIFYLSSWVSKSIKSNTRAKWKVKLWRYFRLLTKLSKYSHPSAKPLSVGIIGSTFCLLFTVDDASGRYTTGYFWGNNYWMGSMAMCNKIFRIGKSDYHTKKQSTNTGLTSINGNSASVQLDYKNPPFFPRFGVLKVILNESLITPSVSAPSLAFHLHNVWLFKFQPRTIHIGICLPSSCDKDDIYVIADSASHRLDTQNYQIKSVRIPSSDGFSLWKDSTFITIL